MNEQKLKYTLKSRLREMSAEANEKARKEVPDLLGITRSWWYRLLNTPLGSRTSLNSDQLLILADYFNCTIDELINVPSNETEKATA